MGTVFENEAYIYSIDSLNHFLFKRDNKNPDIVFRNGRQAQIKGNHEFSISVGLLTTAQYIDFLKSIFSVIATGDDITEESNGSIHLLLGYRYITNKNWIYGVHLNIERYKYNLFTDNKKIGFSDLNYFSLAFDVSYYWLKFDWFHLYSGLGLGIYHISFDTDRNTEVTFKNPLGPAIHINIIGLKAGKKLFFLFETGAGYRGIFTIGLAYKL